MMRLTVTRNIGMVSVTSESDRLDSTMAEQIARTLLQGEGSIMHQFRGVVEDLDDGAVRLPDGWLFYVCERRVVDNVVQPGPRSRDEIANADRS